METIRTTGKMLPKHMDCILNESNQLRARTPSPTHTPTNLAAGKQPALISLPCVVKFTCLLSAAGARGSAVCWGTALQVGRSRVRFPMVPLEFFIDIILPVALWPWGWFSLEQKWVSGIFPGAKGCRCVGLTTLPPSCTDCLEIWEPQPPGTLRACPGL